jgi:MFS family permease
LGSGKILIAVLALGMILSSTYLLAVVLTPEDKAQKGTPARTTATPLHETTRIDFTQHRAFVHLVLARFLFLLGIYGTGRFLLLFVANRLGLPEDQAAEQAGGLLAGLTLISVLASPFTGWLADRFGRIPLMVTGAVFGAISAFMLAWANSTGQILLFGGLMSLGSAAFTGGSWALLADLVPKDQPARFFGLANFGTAGAAAAAGLFGPLIDWTNRLIPGMGFSVLFVAAALAFLASILPLKNRLKENGVRYGNKRKVRPHDPGLAVIPLPADPAVAEEDQDPPGRTARV